MGLSMARPRTIRLTREGLYYTTVFLAVLIGALSRQLNLLMLIGCLLGGPLLFSLLYGRWALRRLVVERHLPTHLHVGERLRVDVSATNMRSRFALWALRVEDSLAHHEAAGSESTGVGVFFPRIAAGETRRVSYHGQIPRRGRYHFGPLRVSTRFPLGLVRHSLVLAEQSELLVHPRLGHLNAGWARMIREYEAGSQHMPRRGLLEADFYGLREWRSGDSRRWIHWRTSARRGTLTVRQFEQRRSQNLALLVDLWQPADASDEALERVETAVSLVATVLAEACRNQGAQITLVIAARKSSHESGTMSPVFFRERLDALALVEAHHEEAFPDSLSHALGLVPTSTPTIIVSTRPIDMVALERAATERDTHVAGRKLHVIDLAGSASDQYFHATSP